MKETNMKNSHLKGDCGCGEGVEENKRSKKQELIVCAQYYDLVLSVLISF